MTTALCPSRTQLLALLTETADLDAATDVTEHVAGCEDCQKLLDELATGNQAWASELSSANLAPLPKDSAFWSAVRRVEYDIKETVLPGLTPAGVRSGGEVSLSFLQPSDRPGFIGRLENFEIVEVIGRGGMGVVLKAFDACLQRFVALKILNPELANSDLAHQRFCREARAAASIAHENVVSIYQVEEVEGTELPFLVMQLVHGESLQERLDRGPPLEMKEIISIAAQAASGLAAAHARGMIHRDIKPGNLLMEREGGRVRISDFGLVRVVEDAKLTQTGMIGGTPLYMAPEQARGEVIDHRADLFSLGAVIYSLCAGQPPWTDSSPFLIMQRIVQEPHKPLREVNPEIPDWFSHLVDRLLAKDPEQRIASAAELAGILNHHVALQLTSGEMKCVAPLSQRLATGWAAYGPMVMAAVASIVLTLLLGLGAARNGFVPASLLPLAPSEPAGLKPAAVLPGNAGPIWSLAFSPQGEQIALGLDDGSLRIWDLEGKHVRATVPAHRGPIWSLHYDKQGKRIATASDDGLVKVWDAEQLTEVARFEHPSSVRAVAFLADGARVVSGTRSGHVMIWDVATKEKLHDIDAHAGVVMSLAISPDGQAIVTVGSDKVARIWDAASGQPRVTLTGHEGGVYSAAFSPDNATVVTGSWDKTVRVWDARTGSPKETLPGHEQDVWTVAFAATGDRFASGSEDRTARLWSLGSKTPLATFRGHTGTIYSVAFTRDGRWLATGGRDGSVLIWDVPIGP